MTSDIRPRRSVLYMPGSNARALEKARALPADALIFDLEDAVAPEMKETARRQVVEAISAGGYGSRELVIRINGLDTAWGHDDLTAVLEARPDAILVPKVSRGYHLERIGDLMHLAGPAPLWAMIETPLAVVHIDEIASFAGSSEAPLRALVLGTNDLARETRARVVPGRQPMLAWLSMAVIAARAHGLDVIDGVYNDFRDEAGLREECLAGRDLGMDGKTLIHPGQIATANEVFAPSAAEVDLAYRIITAFEAPENRGKGAISLDGQMVELLHAEMARRTVALAAAIQAMETAA